MILNKPGGKTMTEEEFKQFDEFLNKTRFDVREIMSTKKRYNQVHDMLYNYMKMGFEEEYLNLK